MFLVCSWYASYPLSIDSLTDSVFDHVSISYWFSLPLILTSMYMIAVTSKSNSVRWIMATGIFVTIYSLSYFYYAVPGSDSHNIRGLTEYFVRTRNLDSAQPSHEYFQWPSFFILAYIATSISALNLINFEFLQYTLIGFLFVSALYIYASKVFKSGGFVAVVAFPVAMSIYFNYQNVPFSLAFSLLLALFMLQCRKETAGSIIAMIVLFTGICITHAFVPLFFVIYLLMRWILNSNKRYGLLFFLTLAIYIIMRLTLAPMSFVNGILVIFSFPTEYFQIFQLTQPASALIDVIAQEISRSITVIICLISIAGFVLFSYRSNKMRDVDIAIFLTGVIYLGTGAVLYVLGSRALPLVFIPIFLGLAYIFENKFGVYLKYLFLILLSLAVFIPLHASFLDYRTPITFQTKEAQSTANFMIEKYSRYSQSRILSDNGMKWYICTQIEGTSYIDTELALRSQSLSLESYDCVIYSIDLARSFQRINFPPEEISRQITDRYNLIYDSGLSYTAEK